MKCKPVPAPGRGMRMDVGDSATRHTHFTQTHTPPRLALGRSPRPVSGSNNCHHGAPRRAPGPGHRQPRPSQQATTGTLQSGQCHQQHRGSRLEDTVRTVASNSRRGPAQGHPRRTEHPLGRRRTAGMLQQRGPGSSPAADAEAVCVRTGVKVARGTQDQLFSTSDLSN